MDGNLAVVRHGNKGTCRLNIDEGNSALPYFTFENIERTGIVEHIFATRLGGVSEGFASSLNFSYERDSKKENVDENFRRIAALFGKTPADIVCTKQTHTVNVRVVTADDKGKGVVEKLDYTDVDGLITNESGIILAAFFADCVPLFVVDPINRAIGLSHSGWRGTVGKMGGATLARMAQEYGTKAENVQVAIAPSICQNCYEVGEDVAKVFYEAFPRNDDLASQYLSRYTDNPTRGDIDECLLRSEGNGKYRLNLWYANYRVFREAGVPDENIAVTDVCTCCNPKLLFSHRASRGRRGNLGAFIMLR